MSFDAIADAIGSWWEAAFDRKVADEAQSWEPAHDLSRPCSSPPSRARLGMLDGTGAGWPDE